MTNGVEECERRKMEELGLECNREIQIEQQKLDSATAVFKKSLESIKAKAAETLQNQENLPKAKAELRGLEDNLVKSLAVKTCKEAKWMTTLETVSAVKARVQELKRTIENRRGRKDEFAAVISQQVEALAAGEEKSAKVTEHRQEVEEAMSWYNRILGFRIECGHGVKFIFTNISYVNPKEEYSFTVRHENDTYTLLDCDPHLNDTNELIHELNRNNGLFEFVRIMRETFQKAAGSGTVAQISSVDQDSSSISMSAPGSSVSTDSRTKMSAKQEDHSRKTKRVFKKVNPGGGGTAGILSPGSASSLRKSPRFKK